MKTMCRRKLNAILAIAVVYAQIIPSAVQADVIIPSGNTTTQPPSGMSSANLQSAENTAQANINQLNQPVVAQNQTTATNYTVVDATVGDFHFQISKGLYNSPDTITIIKTKGPSSSGGTYLLRQLYSFNVNDQKIYFSQYGYGVASINQTYQLKVQGWYETIDSMIAAVNQAAISNYQNFLNLESIVADLTTARYSAPEKANRLAEAFMGTKNYSYSLGVSEISDYFFSTSKLKVSKTNQYLSIGLFETNNDAHYRLDLRNLSVVQSGRGVVGGTYVYGSDYWIYNISQMIYFLDLATSAAVSISAKNYFGSAIDFLREELSAPLPNSVHLKSIQYDDQTQDFQLFNLVDSYTKGSLSKGDNTLWAGMSYKHYGIELNLDDLTTQSVGGYGIPILHRYHSKEWLEDINEMIKTTETALAASQSIEDAESTLITSKILSFLRDMVQTPFEYPIPADSNGNYIFPGEVLNRTNGAIDVYVRPYVAPFQAGHGPSFAPTPKDMIVIRDRITGNILSETAVTVNVSHKVKFTQDGKWITVSTDSKSTDIINGSFLVLDAKTGAKVIDFGDWYELRDITVTSISNDKVVLSYKSRDLNSEIFTRMSDTFYFSGTIGKLMVTGSGGRLAILQKEETPTGRIEKIVVRRGSTETVISVKAYSTAVYSYAALQLMNHLRDRISKVKFTPDGKNLGVLTADAWGDTKGPKNYQVFNTSTGAKVFDLVQRVSSQIHFFYYGIDITTISLANGHVHLRYRLITDTSNSSGGSVLKKFMF